MKEESKQKKVSMHEYNVNANLSQSFLVFVNEVLLLRPGVDYIYKNVNQYEGTYLIFKKALRNKDTLCIQDSGLSEVFWFVVKDGELVDISNDKPNCDGTEWITL
jgi:hypothetical protein